MGVIDTSAVPGRSGTGYPPPHDAGFEGRVTYPLGDAGGLTQFGANLVVLAPGARSSLRHWHEVQDEFVMVTDGTCTLIDDNGAQDMQPGDVAAFPAGVANGHHFVNRTDRDAAFLVIGTRSQSETGWYSDIDMKVSFANGKFNFTRKDGSPLTGEEK